MNLPRSTIAGVLMAGCFALFTSVPAHAGSGIQDGSRVIVPVGLIEKNIGPEGLPSPTASPSPGAATSAATQPVGSPSPSPSPDASTSNAGGIWERVPNGATAPGTEAPAAATTAQAPEQAAMATPTSSAVPPPPAPLGIGAVTPTLQISNLSLKPLVEQALTPAMAASLTITDHAREQILNNHPDRALHLLNDALSIDPSNAYAYLYLGRAWLEKKNYPQALTFFKRAEVVFASDPHWLGETLAFEGLSYEEWGQNAQAEQAYAQALQASPGNLMARVGYTRLGIFSNAAAGALSPATVDSEVAPPPVEAPAPPPPSSKAPEPAN